MTNQNAGSKQFSVYFLVRDTEGTEVVESSVRFDELVPKGTGVELHPLHLTERANGQDGEGRMIEGMQAQRDGAADVRYYKGRAGVWEAKT